jgi:leader peptidase (prepilin peptidase)/N-methyltransferase
MGLIAGSFMGAAFTRLPAGRSVLSGRSACDACGKALGPAELVPLASYLWQRGRCRVCGARIDPALPMIELVAGLVGMAAALLARVPADLIWALFGWLLLLLAALDLRHFWLPDRLTGTLAASGLLAAIWLQPPIAARLIGAAAGFTALEAVRRIYRALTGRQGMGAGDPKLFGAIGAWMGWQALPFILVGASIVGLVAALVAALSGREVSRRTRLPLGACLCAAALLWWSTRAWLVPPL